jgi:hypothetical protein
MPAIPQEAILVTLDNVSYIASTLLDYTAQDILDECERPLHEGNTLVLVRFPGYSTVSHIVRESMFRANATTTAELNDKTFVPVVQL